VLSTETALFYTVVLGVVIFFCRVLPFILFRDEKKADSAGFGPASRPAGLKAFFGFVEKVAPPVAMTVLAFNALAGPVKAAGFPVENAGLAAVVPLAAALGTAVLHIWKRNALVSIFGGTALYMLFRCFIG
jgi:branched-subunit amino acid transport protein AzlD